MKSTLSEPRRWSDRVSPSERDAPAQTAIGHAFEQARQATEPSDTALARVGRRITAPPRDGKPRFVLRLALASALVVATGGVVGAALNKWRQATIVPADRVPPDASRGAPTRDPHSRRGHGPVATVALSTLSEDNTEAPAPVDAPSVPSPVPIAPPAGVVAAAPVATRSTSHPDGAPAEAEVLAGAFRELRTGGDVSAALRSLDRYDRRFPHGALRNEAQIARVEALIAADRRAEALPLLEGIEKNGGTATRDVRIARAELLVEAGRCDDAMPDFAAVLSVAQNDGAGGRALYGRASCHLRSGDVGAACEDLDRFVTLHPGATAAEPARRILRSLP